MVNICQYYLIETIIAPKDFGLLLAKSKCKHQMGINIFILQSQGISYTDSIAKANSYFK